MSIISSAPSFSYQGGTFSDALTMLWAWERGARLAASEARDPGLHRTMVNYLGTLHPDQFRLLLGRHVRDVLLSEAGLAQGKGLKEVVEFLEWVKTSFYIEF